MDTGSPPGGQECDTQGSWIPATPFRPIRPKPRAGYVNGQGNQLEQENWLRSDCFTSGSSQGPQPYRDGADNWNTTSAVEMLSNRNNAEACRNFPSDPMDGWKNVPCTDLLALANAASVYSSLTVGVSGNSNREISDYELPIPHQHSYDLNFCPETMPNAVSETTVSEFTPITPDKAMRANTSEVSQLQNSYTDDRTNPVRDAQNDEVAAERESNSIQCNKELFQPHTETSVATASTELQENHNPDKQESQGIDLNKTPQPKARRKKHRPKVAKENKLKTPKSAITKPAGSGKRKYERKKGLNKDSTCSPALAAGEFVDPKTLEPSKESCRKMLNFDNEGLTGEENITCKSSDLVSESGTKDIHERGNQSKSSLQLEGFEVMTLKPVTPKPAGSKANPKGKRKYVRRKGLNKDSTSSPAVAGDNIDPKPPEPTNESCRISEAGQSRDEHSKSTYFNSVSESQGNEFSKSELIVDLSKWIEVVTPKPADSKKKPTGKRKYVRKQGLNNDSNVSLTEVPVEYHDLRMFEATKKSCRRTLKFDMEGQHRNEKSCRSSFDLDAESQASDFYRRGIQSESTVQLNEGIELTIENTQVGIAYDLSLSMNQKLKDYILLPEGQEPTIPLPTKTNPQQQKQNASFRKDDNTECEGQGAANIGQEATKHLMLQTETQQSPGITNESKCNNCTIFTEPGQAWGSRRKYSNAVECAEASKSNLIGIHYNTLQAYQNPWVPKIHKKKRTEKGQNSSTSSTSSSLAAAKDVTQETCYQDDMKADSSVSKINNSISTPQWNASGIATLGEAGSNLQDKQKTFEGILALTPIERLKKKRSKGLTRVRDLASLTRMAECGMQPTYPGKEGQLDCDIQQVGNSQRPHTCIEALVAEVRESLARKKRTKKRNPFFNSACSSTNEAQKQQKFILYNQQFSTNSLGAIPELTWTQMISIDALTKQLEKVDINRESSHIDHQEQNALVPYSMRYQEQNALVIYNRDGTVVPFHGSFELVKKRRPRPKVDLDEETNRVWKLLLENINSQGIDGTDEENTKWWEEERRVFHGRVDSFIARMHLVQGDRRFSKWKGSVVDSVVGVFLTQNVSDHLSSSAFMSLAAHFPLKSKNQKPCYGEGTSSVTEEPVVYILDPEETVEWTEKMSNQPACDQSSMTLHNTEINEEKEVISGNESFGNSSTVNSINESKGKLLNSCVSDSETCYDIILNRSTTESTGTETICSVGGRIATDYLLSSQNSVVSSQNSMDSSIAENAERTKSSFDSNSEAADLTRGSALNSFNECTSFVELLQMAGSYKLHKVCNHRDVIISSDENSKHETDQFQTMAYDSPKQKAEDLDSPKDFLGESNIPPSNFHPYLTQDSAVEVACYEMFGEETGSSGISMKNNTEGVVKQIAVTPEFTSQTTDATKLIISVQEAPSSSSETKQESNSTKEDKNLSEQHQSELSRESRVVELLAKVQKHEMQHQNLPNPSGETQGARESNNACDNQENIQLNTSLSDLNKHGCSFSKELNEINDATSKAKGRKVAKDKKKDFDWDSLRQQVEVNGRKERPENNMDSLDWEAVRCADVKKIANTIKERGMNNMLAERVKDFLNRIVREHGSIDLEWLRDVPPDKAKEYLLSIRGLGLKSVECVRLLTLHHLAFPVDTNVGRIAVRLGWVPLQPLPESLQLHLLELYPVLESIQKYLWPRLCKLDQRTLYELHYQMITFGKVFCTKSKPNCNACPMRGECRHFASAFASSRLALPGPEERSIVSAKENRTSDQNPEVIINKLPLPLPQAMEHPEGNQQSEAILGAYNCEPIIEEPATPEPECPQVTETDMEDTLCEDPDEIPTIKLNMEEFSQTLQNYMQENMELQEGDMSKALVALNTEVASIPTPKLKNVSRLRTEHQVYELPDSHPLLEGLEKREPDDPGRYLLAIWTPGETANCIQPPEWRCSSQEYGKLCDEKTCFSCNNVRESQSHIVRGTLLIPCRTAMRGSFPLNGTYFQVNEVFADHDSSLSPINVPRESIWNLPRRTVFFGTSIPTIFKGLTTEGIQHCFWRGFVCVRGFDQKTRAPRPLMARLHFPASKLSKTQGKADLSDKLSKTQVKPDAGDK